MLAGTAAAFPIRSATRSASVTILCSWAADRLASIISSTTASLSALRLTSIGFPTPATAANTVVLQNPTAIPTGSTASFSVNNRWLTTVVGRVGTHGTACSFTARAAALPVGSNNPSLTIDGAPVAISASNGSWGFTGGVGIEWAFSGNWSARFEYDFVGLNQTFTLPTPAGGLPTSDQFTGNTRNIQLVNAGLNYKSAAGDDDRRPP